MLDAFMNSEIINVSIRIFEFFSMILTVLMLFVSPIIGKIYRTLVVSNKNDDLAKTRIPPTFRVQEIAEPTSNNSWDFLYKYRYYILLGVAVILGFLLWKKKKP